MNINFIPNISILKTHFNNNSENIVDYCGISSKDDFKNYESIINFKYKIINTKKQLSKICDFISEYKNSLNYDWYIKIRPDIKLIEPINFKKLCDKSINARARFYDGPKSIMYGMSINGDGPWKNIGNCFYSEYEKDIILDDMLYIFHNNVIINGGFDNNIIIDDYQMEWTHTKFWKSNNINLNVIGIFMENTSYNAFSGHLNI